MRRENLEHVVAAAAQIVGEEEFVIVGSQAYGYYAHAAGPETAKAPTGWERLIPVEYLRGLQAA